MKSRTIKQQKTVIASSPGEWDEEVNGALAGLPADAEVDQIRREKLEDAFMAVIEYSLKVLEPEDIRDEFALRGVSYHCEDCPHLRRSQDKRVRWLECDMGMKELTKAASPACPWYYEQIYKAEGRSGK